MAEAKHAFVDDNPYLVYSPNAETTSEGGSGGGGTGFPVIETNTETGALSVTAGELTEMLNNSPVILKVAVNDNSYWVTLASWIVDDEGYVFTGFIIISSETPVNIKVWEAATSTDYPTPSI